MSNINKKVKNARLKKAIKITPEDIKISLENLIDDVNKKTSSIQKEVHDVFEKINKLPGKKYQYKEKFVIDEDHPNFTNEIDKLDYIHESLIFKYAQLEIKLKTLKDIYNKLLKKHIKNIKEKSDELQKEINDKKQQINKLINDIRNNQIHDSNISNRFKNVVEDFGLGDTPNSNTDIRSYFVSNNYKTTYIILKNSKEKYDLIYKHLDDILKEIFKISGPDGNCEKCKYKKSLCICDKCNRCENRNFDKCKCNISTRLRIDVWDKYIGTNINSHKCLCCLKNIIQFKPSTFHCGHIKSRKNGGSISINNLRPICKKCNNEMGILDMNKYIETYHPRLI